MFKLNVGNLDRALRMLLGFALIALAASGAICWWGYVGIVLVITGAIAICPLYSLLGWGTTSR